MRSARRLAVALLVVPLGAAALPIAAAVATRGQVVARAAAAGSTGPIDTSSRDAVREAYQDRLEPALSVPIGWSGSTSTCDAGAPTGAAQAATRQAVNYFRAMVGLRPITFDTALSASAQQAALMMSANQALSHTPPPSWKCWTSAGNDAAKSSDLARGVTGAGAISAYMTDPGISNAAAGHRRWIINPLAATMGSGSTSDANALWVVDTGSVAPRPANVDWISWPSPGYFPAQLEPAGRWSIAANDSVTDFSGATVTVTDEHGEALPVTVDPVQNGYGDSTLVWEVTLGHAATDPDATYAVHVDGILRAGVPTTRDYTVTLFDGVPVPTQPSRFVPVSPARLFDTRSTHSQPLRPLQEVQVAVLGEAGIPATGVVAVTLNLTVTQTSGAGFVTAWPTGASRPAVSNLNVNGPGETVAGQVTVPLGAGGKVSFAAQPRAHLLADVAGYYTPAASATDGRFVPLAPARLFDSRQSTKLGAGGQRNLAVAGAAGVPSAGVEAVVLNVTATETAAAGFVTTWPTGSTRPTASSLNAFARDQTVPNLVTVPLGAGGRVSLFSQTGTQLVVDVAGYYTDATANDATTGLFVPRAPARLFDTRAPGPPAAIAPRATLVMPVAGQGDVPASGAGAVLVNLTATQPLAAGFVTAWPTGQVRPGVSNLNLERPDQTRANAAVLGVGPTGTLSYFSQGGTALVVDVSGYFLA